VFKPDDGVVGFEGVGAGGNLEFFVDKEDVNACVGVEAGEGVAGDMNVAAREDARGDAISGDRAGRDTY
jgi:hypothetical protein